MYKTDSIRAKYLFNLTSSKVCKFTGHFFELALFIHPLIMESWGSWNIGTLYASYYLPELDNKLSDFGHVQNCF